MILENICFSGKESSMTRVLENSLIPSCMLGRGGPSYFQKEDFVSYGFEPTCANNFQQKSHRKRSVECPKLWIG